MNRICQVDPARKPKKGGFFYGASTNRYDRYLNENEMRHCNDLDSARSDGAAPCRIRWSLDRSTSSTSNQGSFLDIVCVNDMMRMLAVIAALEMEPVHLDLTFDVASLAMEQTVSLYESAAWPGVILFLFCIKNLGDNLGGKEDGFANS